VTNSWSSAVSVARGFVIAWGPSDVKVTGTRSATARSGLPESNLVLYAQTTDIPLARQKDIEISLGVDWNPSVLSQ
jgi:hypothetical protein